VGDDPVPIAVGDSALLGYDINVSRSETAYAVIDGAYYVQVTNAGCEATSDLHVITMLQGLDGGEWADIETLEVAYSTVLQPGETAVYEAPVHIEGSYSAYRAITLATIDNYVGKAGQRYGVTVFDGLETLTQETPVVIDEEGLLTDPVLSLPDGFTYEVVGYDGPFDVNGSAEYSVMYEVANVDSDAGGDAVNDVSIALPSGAYANATAVTSITVPEPPGPELVPLTLSKTADGSGVTTFTFRVTVGGDPYVGAYRIGADVFYTTDGIISLLDGQTAELSVPEGSTVQVLETGPTLWRVKESSVNGNVITGEAGRLRTLVASAHEDGSADEVSYTDRQASGSMWLAFSKVVPSDSSTPVVFRYLVTVDGLPYIGGYFRNDLTSYTDDGYVEVVVDGAESHWDTRMLIPVGSQVTVTEIQLPGYALLYSEISTDYEVIDLTYGDEGLTQEFIMPMDYVTATFDNTA